MPINPHSTLGIISETTVPASTATPAPEDLRSTPKPKSDIGIHMAPPTAANDTALVERLRDIVNLVYGETEGDIFVEGYQRVSTEEMVDVMRAGQLAVAHLKTPTSAPSDLSSSSPSSPEATSAIGCMRIQTLPNRTGELGMFAIDPLYRGSGLGRDMVAFAESHCRSSLGSEVMRLELLVPKSNVEHVFKKRLQAWYERMGYVVVKLGVFQDDYPQLAPLLRGTCEYRVFEKNLV
ncbi:hypothetical protein PFICI_04761 [Pestalotiopsis fici W106-1]|uniref:N-acetyltransferase domain-containing protein n=1 Tax=Pestalotiopsis fici (strain W106-1 / CGMCC3.15140) TaxID=1229662 RepID=W3X9Z9_PESFW|nr:uncharacterized protein PFICI_04761 [Pestalotiopsis fici W106-1]ETS82885.1 hypothetical protein PFICI_04761 [Pestalotiopsis fici W106-1]